MTSPALRDHELWRKLRESGTVDELLSIILDIGGKAVEGKVSRDHYEILEQAYTSLQKLTQADPETGKHLIFEHLLPQLLDPVIQTESAYLISQLRDCLANWINQYPESARSSLRDQVLDIACARIRKSRPENAIWAIVHVGYRRKGVVPLLKQTVERYRGETGDIALQALAWLGLSAKDKRWVLAKLHERVPRRWNHYLENALAHLADPTSVDIVKNSWLPAAPGLQIASTYRVLWKSLSLNVLAEIANYNDSRPQLQRRIWGLFVELLNEEPTQYANDILFHIYPTKCDAPEVIPNLANWISHDSSDPEGTTSGRQGLYGVLAKCVRPYQLTGWASPIMDEKLSVIRIDACMDTERNVRAMTAESYLKRDAWNIALCTGRPEVLSPEWFRDAVVKETSPFDQAHVMELLTCFQHRSLPDAVITWITERFDDEMEEYKAREAEYFPRKAAIELATSAGTWGAFEALLNFGLTIEDQVLVDSGEALTNIVLSFRSKQRSKAIARLVDIALNGEKRHRTAAISALRQLGLYGHVSSEYGRQLEGLLFDARLPEYEQGLAVRLLGLLSDHVSSAQTLGMLKEWATNAGDERTMPALETLAYKGLLLPNEGLLSHRLGIHTVDGVYTISPSSVSDDTVGIIGILYHLYPDKFEDIIAALLRTFEPIHWSEAMTLIREIHFHHQKSGDPLPYSVEQELIKLASRLQTTSLAETEIFTYIALLAPDALASEPWQSRWEEWLPVARVSLAEALGLAKVRRLKSKRNAQVLLLYLTADGQFAVRRAAYRSLTQFKDAALASAIESWIASSELELRRRAAEAIAWFDEDTDKRDLFRHFVRALLTDREASVREIAGRSLTELRNRLWAQGYLQKLLSVDSNEGVLQNWCYGQALVALGDDDIEHLLKQESRRLKHPLHIRHWYRMLAEALHDRWRDITRKWPEPIEMVAGQMEHGTGALISADRKINNVEYVIWRQLSNDDRSRSWGGNLLVQGPMLAPSMGTGTQEFILRLPNGAEGRILTTQHSYSTGVSVSTIAFVGQGIYPQANKLHESTDKT